MDIDTQTQICYTCKVATPLDEVQGYNKFVSKEKPLTNKLVLKYTYTELKVGAFSIGTRVELKSFIF